MISRLYFKAIRGASWLFCSPYLLRPIRTFRHAYRDISTSHPELIPAGLDAHTGTERQAEHDYTLAIKNKSRPPKPWRWEIYMIGKSKPVWQSEFFETMSEASHDGREQTFPSKGRIQMSKTNHLQIVTSGLQRTAGPYRWVTFDRIRPSASCRLSTRSRPPLQPAATRR